MPPVTTADRCPTCGADRWVELPYFETHPDLERLYIYYVHPTCEHCGAQYRVEPDDPVVELMHEVMDAMCGRLADCN